MHTHVPPKGPIHAKIVGIGEAPGETEIALGQPFVGASGNLLNFWLGAVGLSRFDIRLDNILPFRPPANKIEAIPAATIAHHARELYQRIAELDDPFVLVPMGNYATYLLTGKGKVKASLLKEMAEVEVTATEAEKKAGITKLRGSLYTYTDLRGRTMKVIPTIHPAWFIHKGGFNLKKQGRAICDWRKIKLEAQTRDIHRRYRTHFIEPAPYEVGQYVEFILRNPHLPLAVDIETWGKSLTCVGFSHDQDYSITVPTHTKEMRELNLGHVLRLCGSPNEKILQNGLYDAYWLEEYGIKLKNYVWDLLCMHHAINPADEHSLDYLSSIYLPEHRYWKDEAKDAEELVKYAKDLDAVWSYNGLDCTSTRELFDYLLEELSSWGALDFYFKHYQQMYEPLLRVMRHGVAVDAKKMSKWSKKLLIECDGLREKLKEMAGEELYATDEKSFFRDPTPEEIRLLWPDGDHSQKPEAEVRKQLRYVMTKKQVRAYEVVLKKDFSDKKLKDFLQKKLKLPKRFKRTAAGRSETLDEATLRNFLSFKKYAHAHEPIVAILEHRSKKKEAVDMRAKWDKDKRMRCTYKLNTEAGRLASSKNPLGKGRNLQNQKRPGPRTHYNIREAFLPDEGCVFVRWDLSQVEDRIVKMYTRRPRMIEMANRHPNEWDAHTYNASTIFNVPEGEVTKDQRYLGKRGVHAAQRGMRGKTLSGNVLKDTNLFIPPDECDRMITAYLDDHHEIRDHYFPFVRRLVEENRMLINTWGRRIRFEFDKFDDDLWRRAFSFFPQSECADLLNQWGLIPIYHYIKGNRLRSRINLQVHDEVIVSAPFEEAYNLAKFGRDTLERPRFYFGERLLVPIGLTVGVSWADARYEWKIFPTRNEFEEVVDACLRERNQGSS